MLTNLSLKTSAQVVHSISRALGRRPNPVKMSSLACYRRFGYSVRVRSSNECNESKFWKTRTKTLRDLPYKSLLFFLRRNAFLDNATVAVSQRVRLSPTSDVSSSRVAHDDACVCLRVFGNFRLRATDGRSRDLRETELGVFEIRLRRNVMRL